MTIIELKEVIENAPDDMEIEIHADDIVYEDFESIDIKQGKLILTLEES